MSEMFKVLGIVGSFRKDSLNGKLWENAVRLAPEGMELNKFKIEDLPLFNQDLETNGLPATVIEMHKAISDSDAILVVTPEYAFGMPGALKNAIDWASRPPGTSAIYGKPGAVLGASMGVMGTVRAQLHVRQCFFHLNMPTVNTPEVLLGAAHTKFDEKGILTDEVASKLIVKVLENLRTIAAKYRD